MEEVDRYRRAKVAESDARRKALDVGEPLRDAEGHVLRPLGASSVNKTLSTSRRCLSRRSSTDTWTATLPAVGGGG